MAYKVRVDPSLCAATTDCLKIAPKTFRLNDQNKAEVIAQGADPDETILQAARTCPTTAIIVEDENGNQIYP